ncbi:YceI family protein [Pontibacter sp. SGAir0037]|uniref:YceI family protein n=1 Tax=Pontibacter sp. SGAir0037 TaxID=2571030 RepID=UPI0010CD4DC7|nr:YceI family protein [Pontibacter sp. SGAir0037]QCR21482.1 hypothetical protein C1N53_03385 [Pontibacter sp. SGAir0037]
MNQGQFFKTAGFLVLLMLLSLALKAQNAYELTGKPELKVSGGSTLHDWEMVTASAQGKAEIIVEDQAIKSIKSGEMTMKSESLKSGKGAMDDIAYKTLKTKSYEDIQFRMTSFKNISPNRMQVTGNLTIAGVTKSVTFEVQPQVKGATVELKGQAAIKFTDYKLTPPTALLGTIKTDNNLKISFKANFQPINL